MKLGTLRLLTALLGVCALLFTSACSGEADPAEEGTKLRVGFNQRSPDAAQATETSLLMALPYMKEEGISVEFVGFDGSTPALQGLEAGHSDISSGLGTGTLMGAVAQGSQFVGFYSGITHNHLGLYAMPDRGLKSLQDLAGKKVGVLSLQSETQLLLETAVATDTSLKPGDVTYVATGGGLDAMQMLADGQIDALYLSDGASVVVQEKFGATEIASPTLENRGFITATTVTKEFFTENKDLLAKFGRAWAKGVVFARENPEAAVRLHWEQFPETKPVDVSDEEALTMAVRQLETRLTHMRPHADNIGDVSPEAVTGAIEMLVKGGFLKETPSAESFWTSELIETMNDFDQEQVRADARSWTPGSER